MATGDGKRNRSNLLGVRLEYDGKKPRAEILNEKATTFEEILNYPNENRFYFGENADVLRALMLDKNICGKVKLAYIDPPYASQVSYASRNQDHAYDDLHEGKEYIEFLRERLILIYELLDVDGSIYVHIDDRMSSYVRILLDEIFGPSNFRREIIRKKCNPKNFTSKNYGNTSDRILFYTKSAKYIWNRPYDTWTDEKSLKEYTYIEAGTGRRFKKVPVHAPGVRNGATGGKWRGVEPPKGKHWQYAPETLDAMDERGEIFWSSNGNPRRKVYFDESSGIAVQDVWLDFKDPHNQNIFITGYPTEKNPDVLRRIIQASSNEGDLVLDCFAGSGTTLAVADELGRKWIGVDSSEESLRTIWKRLAHGMERMGNFRPKKNDDQLTLELAEPKKNKVIREFSLFSLKGTKTKTLKLLAE